MYKLLSVRPGFWQGQNRIVGCFNHCLFEIRTISPMERVDLVKSEYLMAIFKIPLFKSYSTFVTRMLVGKAISALHS